MKYPCGILTKSMSSAFTLFLEGVFWTRVGWLRTILIHFSKVMLVFFHCFYFLSNCDIFYPNLELKCHFYILWSHFTYFSLRMHSIRAMEVLILLRFQSGYSTVKTWVRRNSQTPSETLIPDWRYWLTRTCLNEFLISSNISTLESPVTRK